MTRKRTMYLQLGTERELGRKIKLSPVFQRAHVGWCSELTAPVYLWPSPRLGLGPRPAGASRWCGHRSLQSPFSSLEMHLGSNTRRSKREVGLYTRQLVSLHSPGTCSCSMDTRSSQPATPLGDSVGGPRATSGRTRSPRGLDSAAAG